MKAQKPVTASAVQDSARRLWAEHERLNGKDDKCSEACGVQAVLGTLSLMATYIGCLAGNCLPAGSGGEAHVPSLPSATLFAPGGTPQNRPSSSRVCCLSRPSRQRSSFCLVVSLG